jgi:hypothetical protein
VKVTVNLSKRDLATIAAYIGLDALPDSGQAGAYVHAAVRSCLSQDECYRKAKTSKGRIRARVRQSLKEESPRG